MKTICPALKKVIAGVLSSAVVLSCLVGVQSGGSIAMAADGVTISLPQIESLAYQGGAFNILEVAPAAGQGSIGYYINGQEPCRSWTTVAGKQEGAEARKKYFDSVFGTGGRLETLGLIGSDTANTPLTYGEAYIEKKPWEDTTGYAELSLNRFESATVKGTITPAEGLRGRYKFGAFFAPANDEHGGWVQMITHLTSRDLDEDSTQTRFYYSMSFTEIETYSDVLDGTLVCVLNENADTADLVGVSANVIGGGTSSLNLDYLGTKGDAGFPGMSTLQRHFAVEIIGVSATKDDTHPYCAVGSDFRKPYTRPEGKTEPAWFTATNISYTYVGTGGDYNFTPGNDTEAKDVKIEFSTVFYKGGFTNNEWFYHHVFDWDGPKTNDPKPTIALSVSSVTPNQLTPELVAQSSMIVLSAGMSFDSDTSPAYDASAGISPGAIEAIKTANTEKKPIVVDNALLQSESDSIKTLASELKKGNDKDSFVSGNLYFFIKDGDRLNLATSAFGKAYDSALYETDGSAYYEVYDNITEENFLRDTEGVNKLEAKVTLARCIRHIIAGSRTTKNKTEIKVLDIEPAYSAAKNRGTDLTPEKVLGWLGKPDKIEPKNIEITSISTAELVGKIDDIREKYDLVYIGNNVKPYKTKEIEGELTTLYNDKSMNGLVYTNIGDTVVSGGESGWSLSGLLDRDFNLDDTFTSSVDTATYHSVHVGHTLDYYNDSRTFRYSGNDITDNVVSQITDFANSGLPIVVADGLTTNIEIGDKTFTGATWANQQGYYHYKVFNGSFFDRYGKFEVAIDHDGSNSTLTPRIKRIDIPGDFNVRVKTAAFKWYHLDENGRYTLIEEFPALNDLTKYDDNALIPAASINVRDYGYETGMFYCEVIPLEVGGGSYEVRNQNDPVSHSISQLALVTTNVNPNRVDNCSNMYKLLAGIYKHDYPNVKSAWELTYKESLKNDDARAKVLRNQAEILKRTNISKPEIVFTENAQKQKLCYPTPYSMDTDGKMTSLTKPESQDAYYLEYRFTIERRFDPTPAQTSFTAKLYIDANADGRYADTEWLNDTVFREWDDKSKRPGALVDSDKLTLGVEYIASRRMPADKVGILPWKLEVVKNYSAENAASPVARNSVTDYTHIAPEKNQAEVIEILQINTSRTKTSWWGETQKKGLNLQENIERKEIFGQLFDKIKNDIRVNITTITADKVDSEDTWKHKFLTIDPTSGETYEEKKYTELADYLNSYDMLIMGFDDCYQELSVTSAKAIVNFIDSGKATLFSHDNTSFFFLPVVDYQTENEGTGWIHDFVYARGNSGGLNDLLENYSAFGYNFNMAIRNAVGLDRYGIADPKYGISKFAPAGLRGNPWTGNATSDNIKQSESHGGWVASGYAGSKATDWTTLEKAGYSVAYKAKSAKTETVPETQGLTKGVLIRYHQDNDDVLPTFGTVGNPDNYPTGHLETISKISQVNKGQLTTYPFDINTNAFNDAIDDNGNRISISDTHFQYQQLNMNTDDVVVWYCLAGGSLDYMPNDVVNDYYIYSKGNVTYTGFGHTTDHVDEDEAKLFVNTMIAAYRVSQQDPVVRFTDRQGVSDVDSFFMPSDNGEIIEKSVGDNAVVDNSRKIFFTVNDTNLGDSKTMHANFKYAYTGKLNDDGKPKFGGDIDFDVYDAENNQKLEKAYNLLSGRTYYIRLDDVLRILKTKDNSTSVSTHFKDGDGPLKIDIQVSSTIGENERTSQPDSITLYKLDLFNLN